MTFDFDKILVTQNPETKEIEVQATPNGGLNGVGSGEWSPPDGSDDDDNGGGGDDDNNGGGCLEGPSSNCRIENLTPAEAETLTSGVALYGTQNEVKTLSTNSYLDSFTGSNQSVTLSTSLVGSAAEDDSEYYGLGYPTSTPIGSFIPNWDYNTDPSFAGSLSLAVCHIKQSSSICVEEPQDSASILFDFNVTSNSLNALGNVDTNQTGISTITLSYNATNKEITVSEGATPLGTFTSVRVDPVSGVDYDAGLGGLISATCVISPPETRTSGSAVSTVSTVDFKVNCNGQEFTVSLGEVTLGSGDTSNYVFYGYHGTVTSITPDTNLFIIGENVGDVDNGAWKLLEIYGISRFFRATTCGDEVLCGPSDAESYPYQCRPRNCVEFDASALATELSIENGLSYVGSDFTAVSGTLGNFIRVNRTNGDTNYTLSPTFFRNAGLRHGPCNTDIQLTAPLIDGTPSSSVRWGSPNYGTSEPAADRNVSGSAGFYITDRNATGCLPSSGALSLTLIQNNEIVYYGGNPNGSPFLSLTGVAATLNADYSTGRVYLELTGGQQITVPVKIPGSIEGYWRVSFSNSTDITPGSEQTTVSATCQITVSYNGVVLGVREDFGSVTVNNSAISNPVAGKYFREGPILFYNKSGPAVFLLAGGAGANLDEFLSEFNRTLWTYETPEWCELLPPPPPEA